eukprot:492137-Pelagomonas_calceolata.AAC.3
MQYLLGGDAPGSLLLSMALFVVVSEQNEHGACMQVACPRSKRAFSQNVCQPVQKKGCFMNSSCERV